jgi:hypothetical protein
METKDIAGSLLRNSINPAPRTGRYSPLSQKTQIGRSFWLSGSAVAGSQRESTTLLDGRGSNRLLLSMVSLSKNERRCPTAVHSRLHFWITKESEGTQKLHKEVRESSGAIFLFLRT